MAKKEQQGNIAKSYTIRAKHDGDFFLSDEQHVWGTGGELPTEWGQVKEDPTVVTAEIFPANQRSRRADKRKLTDSYTRE